MATRMQQRRGTAAQWAAGNPVLAAGEIGYETDTRVVKVGDGTTSWNNLLRPAGTGEDLYVNVKDFGAKGDGSTNDKVAIQAAFDVASSHLHANGGKVVYFPRGTYMLNNIVVDQGWTTIRGPGRLVKNANGPMFIVNARFAHFRLEGAMDGNAPTYTGPGIEVPTDGLGGDFLFGESILYNTQSYCIDIVGVSSAPRAHVSGMLQAYQGGGVLASIRLPANEANGDRTFFGIYTGGTPLINLNGCGTTNIIGCNMADGSGGTGIMFTSISKKVSITGCRLPIANLQVKGIDHVIVGNMHAGTVTLDNSTSNCVVVGNRIIGTPTNNGTNNIVQNNAVTLN